ncbi:MAG: 23S rRNA (adenine(2503)-C(2))-methyltransferase RlmN [Christensenellaceae bacterium]|jgi:23S rRNA (adenine2503-C2)-methyltransferase|nr:23S rRNA (adenine(2503)-C(2))-methyltransferase RlmN [Christensenellaceae bacterium]
MRPSLQDLSFEEIAELVKKFEFPTYRTKQLYDMVLRCKEYNEATNLPLPLKQKFENEYDAISVALEQEFCGKSNVKKYLYRLRDGITIEGVYMPHGYGDSLCVSTQAGCRMACSFCASGLNGLERNLETSEIFGQVLLAERLNARSDGKRAITNIVLMGSGEPLDNYTNVIKFISLVNSEASLNISERNISLSTVGLPDKIRELADSGHKVTLAISLHAPTDEKRNKIIPQNRKHCIAEIINAVKYYFEKTGRRIIFEYALAKNENSTLQSANELIILLRGIPCHVNLIPLNFVKEKKIEGADSKTVNDFLNALAKGRISATVRRSMGSDIFGACGQLRLGYLEGSNARS